MHHPYLTLRKLCCFSDMIIPEQFRNPSFPQWKELAMNTVRIKTITAQNGITVTAEDDYKNVNHGWNLGWVMEKVVKVTGTSGGQLVWEKSWSTPTHWGNSFIAKYLMEKGLSQKEAEELGFYLYLSSGGGIGI
jgi:hypothetical protein